METNHIQFAIYEERHIPERDTSRVAGEIFIIEEEKKQEKT
jgi:hypothetical protein